MAFGDLSGVKSARYDTVSAMTSAVDLGSVREDSSGQKVDVKTTPEGSGQTRYAGNAKELVLNVNDMSKFAGLETLMKANTEIYVELTDLEANTKIIGPAKPKVWQADTKPAPGDTAFFELKMTYFEA